MKWAHLIRWKPETCGPASTASESQFFQYECRFWGSRLRRRFRRCNNSPCCTATGVSGRKAHNMRTRYFGWEYVFEHIWQHCNRDGLWDGDAASVAADFQVSEDEADDMLCDLADQGLIEKLVPGK